MPDPVKTRNRGGFGFGGIEYQGRRHRGQTTFGASLNTDYILGITKIGGNVKILLDIDRVLSTEEVAVLEKAA